MRILNSELTIEWLRNRYTGRGITVAVIDSGVDATHPDLRASIERGCDVSLGPDGTVICEEVGPEQCADSYGHGSGVTGCILGIAPEVRVVSIKVLNKYNLCTGTELIAGMRWALDQNIKLINMSLATVKQQYTQGLNELCERAYLQDAIVVAAKRNFGGYGWPAAFSSVISVDRDDVPERFFVRYQPSGPIEFAAHGTDVVVPALGGGHAQQTGSSYAAPHVTGMVALLLEAFPGLLAWEAKTILKFLFATDATSD